MSNSQVNVALVQKACGDDCMANLDQTVELIQQAIHSGAKIICLQEVFHLPYPCQTEDHNKFALAEPITGSVIERMQGIAGKNETVIVVPIFERRAPGIYHNSAVVIDADGSLLGTYRKMHIPDDPLYYEKFYFTPGDLGFRSFSTRYGNVGVCICWDQWFPEAARLTALAGAEIIFFPTAIGWHPDEKADYGESQHAAWETMMRSHAIANNVYVAAPNRVGCEGNLEFWGGSFICDPYGQIIQKASHTDETVIMGICDWSLIETSRTHWPFLRDRRIDAYQGLSKRFLDHE